MKCYKCDANSIESTYGPWCDTCGGVAYPSGEMYVRHVATAMGAGGEHHILFDSSLNEYSFLNKRLVKVWLRRQGRFATVLKTFINHGNLDLMIALAQPFARGDGAELPDLLAGTGATEEEKEILKSTIPDPVELPSGMTYVEPPKMDEV